MNLIILLLLIGCGVFLFNMFKTSSKQNNKQDEEQGNKNMPYSKDELRIENVDAGGVIHITNIGPDMQDFDISIIAKHMYKQGNFAWYELEGETNNGKIWIELEDDDELEISVTLKKLKLEEIGITKTDLDKIDDQEKGEINYNNKKYYYEDSDNAIFYKYSDLNNPEKFYYWDFESNDEEHFIGVEKWSNKDYEASLSESVSLSQITVYSVKKET